MFEDLRQAWKEAVENFWRELDEDAGDPARKQLSSMRQQLGTAEGELRRLQVELTRAQNAAAAERREEETCRRRQTMAEGIGDADTAHVAQTFAERAAERAAVMERKAEVLEAEQALRTRELSEMRASLDAASAALAGTSAGQTGAAGVGAGAGTGAAGPDESYTIGDWPDPANPADADRLKHDVEYRRMQREAKEKAADARLEELKRKMQQ